MILSIVSGTYNRITMLKNMIQSCRDNIPRHITHEFVIVDGGSTDGSLEWLREQPDVRLIEHGELRGAINAFTEGAYTAQGEYVILANDDVTFRPYSIMRALRHLETHPDCGAVAFADNRSAATMKHIHEHRVEYMGALTLDGAQTSVPYAQVGMFRKWLGDTVGWWGADDEIMQRARTYGGDNYLSARIWELGYSVDGVPDCKVDDHIAGDDLRKVNASTGSTDSAAFYERYPGGVQLRDRPTIDNPQRPKMRILYFPVYEPGHPMEKNNEYGLGHALARVGLCWEHDFLNRDDDWLRLVDVWKPDMIMLQIQNPGDLNEHVLSKFRRIAPHTIIVNWNGDAHEPGLISPDVLRILREVDLQLCINAAVLPRYQMEGIPADYWQIGYKDPVTPLPDVPAHDVLFQGNCYNDARTAVVNTVKALPYNVGLYGNCQGANGNSHYDWAKRKALNVNAKIVIGDTFDPEHTEGFVSNRVFQVLADGGFLLQQWSKNLDQWTGLKPGVHYIEWRTLDDIPTLVEYYLNHPDERDRIAKAGQAFVREHFSHDAQVRKLFTDLLPKVLHDRARLATA